MRMRAPSRSLESRSGASLAAERRGSAMTPSPVAGWSYQADRVGSKGAASADLRALHQPRRIAGHQVDLEIDRVAGAEPAERRDLERIRNARHREGVARNLVDGQRYPVERDRTLRCNETGKLRRHAQSEPRHVG